MDTGLAPGWVSAVGDSGRLRINQDDGGEVDGVGVGVGVERGDVNGNGSAAGAADDDDDETLTPGSAKGGYRAYLRGVEEDVMVRKHWEVACELHRESILELGRIREWILGGGRFV